LLVAEVKKKSVCPASSGGPAAMFVANPTVVLAPVFTTLRLAGIVNEGASLIAPTLIVNGRS
jgi:hypothetical protein